MGTVTNYLKLRFIALKSTDWYSDFNFNLGRIDLLGKLLRLQAGPGQSSALRCELGDGTLAEYVRAVPNGEGVDIYLGRSGSQDRVIIRSTEGSLGETVRETWGSDPVLLAAENLWYALSPVTSVGDGQWKLAVDVCAEAEIVGLATPTAIDVTVAVLSNGFPLFSTTFTVAQGVTAQRQPIHFVTPELPGNSDYIVSMRYTVVVNGAYGSVSLDSYRNSGLNYIEATRVA